MIVTTVDEEFSVLDLLNRAAPLVRDGMDVVDALKKVTPNLYDNGWNANQEAFSKARELVGPAPGADITALEKAILQAS